MRRSALKLPDGTEQRRFRHEWPLCLAFAGRQRLVGGDHDLAVHVWDALTDKKLHALKGHTGIGGRIAGVFGVASAPDGKGRVGRLDGTVRFWDAETGKELRRTDAHVSGALCVAFSADGKRLATGGADNAVRLWDTETLKETRPVGEHAAVTSLAIAPDGKLLATGGRDGTLRLSDALTGKEMRALSGHSGEVCALAFAPDGSILASGGDDRTARLWDVETGGTAAAEGHTHRVSALPFAHRQAARHGRTRTDAAAVRADTGESLHEFVSVSG
jgi:WD40 repeat protein